MEGWAVHRKSKFTETEKGETGQENSQEHAHDNKGIKLQDKTLIRNN
jgi:hypothetical protein